MLRKAILNISQSGTVQLAAFARELGVNEQLAEQLIDELIRLGYLRVLMTENFNDSCARCSLHTSCLHRHQLKIWTITEKAEQFLSREQG